jgi:hypothetical protein
VLNYALVARRPVPGPASCRYTVKPFCFSGHLPGTLDVQQYMVFSATVYPIAAMKDTIYIILAILCAALTFFFLVKKMKDDCIP